jgi:hypothetical protein
MYEYHLPNPPYWEWLHDGRDDNWEDKPEKRTLCGLSYEVSPTRLRPYVIRVTCGECILLKFAELAKEQ